MNRIVYPPNHGSNRRRSPSKRRCHQCRGAATHVEITERPAARLRLNGSMVRFVENVAVYWCGIHTEISAPN